MDRNNVYWFGSYLQVLVMIAFFVNIWRTKNCSGISLRSQFLYALIFTIRHQDLNMPYLPVENIILKTIFLVVTYGTVLSMLMYFPKTYEKQHDKTRIDIWIVACFLLGLLLNDRFDFLQIMTMFSIYLEAIAMIPQFQFIIKTQRIDEHVILYLTAMAGYTVLSVAYYSTMPYGYVNFRIAGAAIQLLLYCDFFYAIYPLLNFQNDSNQDTKTNCCGCFGNIYSLLCSQKSDDVEADVEAEEVSKKGFLANNVGNVVLMPSTLIAVPNEKESSGN